MIFAVAGIPSEHFNRIQKQAPRIFGSKPIFIGASLRPDDDGHYRVDATHIAKLAEALTKRIKQEPSLVEHGCGLIILAPEGYDTAEAAAQFKPFALVRTIRLPQPVLVKGRPGDIYGNIVADVLRGAAVPLIRAVAAVETELSNRLNRSPLLLPLRNFESDLVSDTIFKLTTDLPLASDPNATIAAACKKIESEFPFSKIVGSPRRCFINSKDIQFRPPQAALHGSAVSCSPPHNGGCLLNGLLRLGGAYHAGFHYDCIRDRSDGRRRIPLNGDFHDCHGGSSAMTGVPHLNIAPNDFVRP